MTNQKTTIAAAAASAPSAGYAAILVDVARTIAEVHRKDMLIILAYDHGSEKTCVVTWGREVGDKENAARVGEHCAAFLRCDETRAETHEDYRREGEAAKRVDCLTKLLRGVVERCEANGNYVGLDGQYIKELRAALSA